MSAEKAALRSIVRERLVAMSGEYRTESDGVIRRRLMALPEYKAAKRLFIYYSVDSEADTRGIIECAMGEGKTVAVPVSQKGGEMDFVRYTGEMRPGLHGIPEPSGEHVPLFPAREDIIVVPALCFDIHGNRLGHGGGYYDRYLARFNAITAGLCREALLMEKIPTEGNDIAVKIVITEERTIRI